MPNDTTPNDAAPSAREMDVLERITRANLVVSELCDGTRRWTMSIPVRPDDDADIVIGRALHESTKEITSLRAQLAAAEGQARGSEAMLIQAQRDCDNAQNAELVALSQLAEMTKERDDMRRTYELKVQDFASETRRATQLSDELKAERENNATLRQTANWNTALGVLEMREQIHVGGAGSIKGMCANCQTWHPLYEIYPECSDCFDETTQRRAVERLTTALAERDAQVGRIAKLDWYYADVQGNIEKAFLVADIDAALASAANAEGKSDSDSTGPRATEEG